MIWDIILKDLGKKLDSAIFNRYIKNIKYNEEQSNANVRVLEVDNVYLQNWLKTHFANRISLLFETHTDIKPEIKFILKQNFAESTADSAIFKEKIMYKNSVLNASFTFDNFEIGKSNEHPLKLAKLVAKEQGKNYNPLFISGNTGVGKTHLLNAIGNYNAGQKNVILITSEEFLNDYMIHLSNKTMERFREKYRKCDYLLIDDIQFFSGKSKIQEEFFQTFNILKNNNSQIVLTSDKPIKELNGIEERLKSRFESGIISRINPPEFELKKSIIKKKCELDLIKISDEIIEYIAININDNIRTIEGILTTINSFSSIMNQEITIDLVRNEIENSKRSRIGRITLDEIILNTAKHLNIKPSDIKSKKRTKDILLARKIVIYLGRNISSNSMPELAKALDMKDHSTISKAVKKIQSDIEKDSALKQKILEIQSKIKEIKK
ncbi:chromosomal replication initiator protein DnaA [Helicobacter sp. 23-1045]